MAEFQFRPIPFYEMLSGVGDTLASGISKNRLRNSLSDFQGDYTQAAEELMRMGYVDEATKLYTAGELAKYRDVQGQVALGNAQPSAEDELLRMWMRGQEQAQPNYLAPSELDSADAREAAEAAGMAPSGVPGVNIAQNLDNAPKVVQEKLGTTQQIRAWEERGKAEGTRQGMQDALVAAAPGLQGIVDNMVAIARDADPETFEHALGPWQGGMEAETLSGAIGQNIVQTAGAAANYFDQGMKEGFVDWKTGNIKHPKDLPGGFTSTLRAQVNSTAASLINLMQRLLRVPGIGQQSDYELRQIIAQAGELNKSRTKEDYHDRLTTILTNLKSLGFPIEVPSLDQVTGPSGKQFTDRLEPEPAAASAAPAARKVPTYSVDPMTGSMAPTAAPDPYAGMRNKPPKTATPGQISGLKRELSKHKPGSPEAQRIIEAFDSLIGAPGSAEFYLLRSR